MSGPALSEEQTSVARSEATHVMVIAPPGCGKTEVLAHRAAFLISSLGKNQRLLALTFTNRAKANLEERLRSVLGQAQMRRYITVRNFHGHATQIVLAHGRTIGLEVESLLLPQTSTLRKALESTNADRGLRSAAESMLSAIKRMPLSDDEVLTELGQQQPDQACELAEYVERQRQAANQLHYDDLLRHAQRLLLIPAVARLYQCHFGAVLVDEFQDLSMQHLDIARLSCTARQTYAGDPLQGIFSWAGASPAEVEAEIRQVCGAPIRLHESYRSSPKVLDTVNSLSETVDPESTLVSAQPKRWADEGCSAALVYQDRGEEARAVTRFARSILERNASASVGIISRAGWRREDIDRAFAAETDLAVRSWDLAIEDPRVMALIQQTVATLPRGVTVQEAHLAVLDVVDPSDVDTLEQVDDAFAALKQNNATTARAAVRSIRVADPQQAVGPGVHLLNAHTGKGQQFDWVFVVGLEEGHLPGKRNSHGRALEEEQRVLLVMLSRARHGLVLSRVRMNDGWYGPRPATESRWWSGLRSEFDSAEEIEAHLVAAFAGPSKNDRFRADAGIE